MLNSDHCIAVKLIGQQSVSNWEKIIGQHPVHQHQQGGADRCFDYGGEDTENSDNDIDSDDYDGGETTMMMIMMMMTMMTW